MSRAQFRDDNRFYKDRLPPNNASDWACKPNDGIQETAPNRSQTPPARPVRTESTTLNRPINPPVRSASTGSASTERTTLNVRPINPPVRPAQSEQLQSEQQLQSITFDIGQLVITMIGLIIMPNMSINTGNRQLLE